MWPLETLKSMNARGGVRHHASSYPILYQVEADLERPVPGLAHSPERHDRHRSRLATVAEWDHMTLKDLFQAHGPLLAAQSEGTLICWSPLWAEKA
jgi:hypothetical protein